MPGSFHWAHKTNLKPSCLIEACGTLSSTARVSQVEDSGYNWAAVGAGRSCAPLCLSRDRMEDLRSYLVPTGFLYSLLAVGVNLGQLKYSGPHICNL